MKKYLLLGVFSLVACAHSNSLPSLPGGFTSESCENTFFAAKEGSADNQLDRVSDLYSRSCFQEVVVLGEHIRRQYRSKFYSVSSELAEVAVPEGTFTAYVLESYERTYLSLLMAASYLNLQKEDPALVELRRAHEEEVAWIYNYGADPVLNLLQATMWDRFNPALARSHWQLLAAMKESDIGYDANAIHFARQRITEIDRDEKKKVNWRVVGIGYLPELNWETQFLKFNQSPYVISPKEELPKSCSTVDEALLSTQSWIAKINQRHKADYHPLLFTKTLVRLPIAFTYGVLGVGAGIGIGVVGCALSSDGKGNSSPQLCEAAVQAGAEVIRSSGNLVEYTMRPDLRHWSKVPRAFFISRGSQETCLQTQNLAMMKTVYLME